MMQITLQAMKSACGTECDVIWRTGLQRMGIVHVTGIEQDNLADSELIAEAAALQYLLFSKQVFDREPEAGAGYKLTVSKGAIKKASKGKTSKKFLVPYTRYLTTRMSGIEIVVCHNSTFLDFDRSGSDVAHDQLSLSAGADQDGDQRESEAEIVDAGNIGQLKITKHAYQQFVERLGTGEPKKPWAALTSRLKNPEMQQRNIPEKVLKHKARKYGDVTNLEVWGHPSSGMNFVGNYSAPSKE